MRSRRQTDTAHRLMSSQLARSREAASGFAETTVGSWKKPTAPKFIRRVAAAGAASNASPRPPEGQPFEIKTVANQSGLCKDRLNPDRCHIPTRPPSGYFSCFIHCHDLCGRQLSRIGLGTKTSHGRAMPFDVKRNIANPTRGNESARCRAPGGAAGARNTGLHRSLVTEIRIAFLTV